MRRTGIVVLALGITVMLFTGVARAAKPSLGCAKSFNEGELTLSEAQALPRVDPDSLAEAFAQIDHNGDGEICAQDVYQDIAGSRPNENSNWQFLYNFVDNNASKPA